MKKLLCIFMMALTMCALGLPIYAAEPQLPQDEPAFSEYGQLIDYAETKNEDGSITKEYLYKQINLKAPRSDSYGTDTFTKVELQCQPLTGTPQVKYKITATFDWDKTARTVKVRNPVGEIVEKYDSAKIEKEKTTTSGSGTKKASASFGFNRVLGLSNNRHTVTVSCDYKGKNS